MKPGWQRFNGRELACSYEEVRCFIDALRNGWNRLKLDKEHVSFSIYQARIVQTAMQVLSKQLLL